MLKLTLFPKLFFAFLLTACILVLGMVMSVNWTFERGLRDYLHQKDQEELAKLIPVLERLYAQHGDWQRLRNNRRRFGRVLREAFGHPPPPFGRPPDDAERPPRPPHRPRLLPHLYVLDAQGQKVVGRKKMPPDTPLQPLHHENQLIGWVGVARHHRHFDQLAHAFYQQQTHHYYWIAALGFLLSALTAGLLVRQLLVPVQRITQAARSLSGGDYQTRIQVASADELGQLAQDMNHLAHTLASNEHARRQWIADISHELRTPLAVLRGSIEAMQDGVRAANPENLHKLHQETLNLSALVDDLYELTLSDLGALDYRKEAVDVCALLAEITVAFAPRFQEKNLCLDNQITGKQEVFADARRLRQLFSNVLENSLRYTDSGGGLEIHLQRDDKHLAILFDDTAPGVDDAVLDKLFERLYRVDKSRSRALGGAGLGLSICRNIVLAHKGEIRAECSDLGGLRLRIELPRLASFNEGIKNYLTVYGK